MNNYEGGVRPWGSTVSLSDNTGHLGSPPTQASHTVVVDEEVDMDEEVDEEVEEEMDSLSDNTGHLASSPKQVTPYPWVAYLSFAASF